MLAQVLLAAKKAKEKDEANRVKDHFEKAALIKDPKEREEFIKNVKKENNFLIDRLERAMKAKIVEQRETKYGISNENSLMKNLKANILKQKPELSSARN